MTAALVNKGFEVVPAVNATEALKLITTEIFDVLITNLHMPSPSDAAVITATRHIQPKALTPLVSGYLDVKSAMDAMLMGADKIIVRPFETEKLAALVNDKLLIVNPLSLALLTIAFTLARKHYEQLIAGLSREQPSTAYK